MHVDLLGFVGVKMVILSFEPSILPLWDILDDCVATCLTCTYLVFVAMCGRSGSRGFLFSALQCSMLNCPDANMNLFTGVRA